MNLNNEHYEDWICPCQHWRSDLWFAERCFDESGCGEIYKEYASGESTQARPELANCLRVLRSGDTLTVWRLDRLGRSLSDLVAVVNDLEKRGIGFESLSERIDTTSAFGKLIFHVFASMAEFERNLVRERTHAGLDAARARGRKAEERQSLVMIKSNRSRRCWKTQISR